MDDSSNPSKKPEVPTHSKKTARALRANALPQNVRQQITSWRPESSNIRKWNVTSSSQFQAQNSNHPPPTNLEAPVDSQLTIQCEFLPQPRHSHDEEHTTSQSSSLAVGSSTPVESQLALVSVRGIGHDREDTSATTLPPLEASDKNPAESRMSLDYITNPNQSKSQTEHRHDRRPFRRRFHHTSLANRNQPRHTRPLIDSRATLPRLTFDSFLSERRNLTPSNLDPNLSLAPSLITTIDPLLRHTTPSVSRSLGSSTWDPFHTGTILLTPHMENVLLHYFTVILPAVEPMQSESDDFKSWAIPLTNTKPAMLYALVASMAHDMEQSSLAGLRTLPRSNLVAEYRLKAIQFINECLADTQMVKDPSTLTAIHYLLWQEIFAGDENIRLESVRTLLELRGGFHGVQRKALEGVMVGCFWRAVRTRSKPILPMITDDLYITDERFRQIKSTCDATVARLGEAFLASDFHHYFDDEMLQLLQDARKTWVCFELIGHYPFLPDEKRSLTIKRCNIDHRLLSYPFDHYGMYRPIQEACRQAVIVFSHAHYNVIQPSSKIGRCLVENLKNALERTDLRSCWGSANTMLLWALFLGAHMSSGERERPWFVNILAIVAQNIQLGDWIQVRAILVRFYYVDRVFQEPLRRIWDEVGLIAAIQSKFS